MAIVFAYTVATNTVVVTGGTSGTPATFANFVTADRAGTGTSLKAASAASATYTLTYAVRPVELLAVVVKCIVAAKTTQTDYLFISGHDAWGTAQTESIDVSAGNGSYTSTKRWSVIDNIDCSDNAAGGGTVWADGTLAVTQDIWGVIWNQGLGKYQVDANFTIGDYSTATYFQSTREAVIFSSGFTFKGVTAATMQFGLKGALDSCYNGSYIRTNKTTGYHGTQGTGTILFYGSFWQFTTTSEELDVRGNASELRQSLFQDGFCVAPTANGIVNRITIGNMQRGFVYQGNPTASDIVIGKYQVCGIMVQTNYGAVGSNITISDDDSKAQDFRVFSMTVDSSFIDSTAVWNPTWIGGAANTADLLEKYSCNINICDSSGVALSSVAVDCVDVNGAALWTLGSVTTDVSGNITQQLITTHKYEVGGITGYHPFKFTISKAGYQTLVLDNITVSAPIKWHLEMQNCMDNNFSKMTRINS
jgi:hypothetical protein